MVPTNHLKIIGQRVKKHFNIFCIIKLSDLRTKKELSRCDQRVFSRSTRALSYQIKISELINQTIGRRFETARCNMQRDETPI